MLVLTSWLEKSRKVLPSWSHTVLPEPPAIAMGFSAFCADQEWKTLARSRATTSALLRAALAAAAVMSAAGRVAGLATMTVPLDKRIGSSFIIRCQHQPAPYTFVQSTQ